VLCIPIQNQESAQSNMIYSCGLRSIIDLKEGRKTTWCTISFSSNLHDLSNLRSIDNSHMFIPQSSPYSVLVVVLLIFLRHLSIVIDSDSSVDGNGRFSWMRIDRTHCTSKTGRFRDRGTETQNFKFVICTLYWQPRIHVRRLARTTDWTGARSQCAVTGRLQDCSAPWLCRASVVLTVTL
jgi:hypothetical protein